MAFDIDEMIKARVDALAQGTLLSGEEALGALEAGRQFNRNVFGDPRAPSNAAAGIIPGGAAIGAVKKAAPKALATVPKGAKFVEDIIRTQRGIIGKDLSLGEMNLHEAFVAAKAAVPQLGTKAAITNSRVAATVEKLEAQAEFKQIMKDIASGKIPVDDTLRQIAKESIGKKGLPFKQILIGTLGISGAISGYVFLTWFVNELGQQFSIGASNARFAGNLTEAEYLDGVLADYTKSIQVLKPLPFVGTSVQSVESLSRGNIAATNALLQEQASGIQVPPGLTPKEAQQFKESAAARLGYESTRTPTQSTSTAGGLSTQDAAAIRAQVAHERNIQDIERETGLTPASPRFFNVIKQEGLDQDFQRAVRERDIANETADRQRQATELATQRQAEAQALNEQLAKKQTPQIAGPKKGELVPVQTAPGTIKIPTADAEYEVDTVTGRVIRRKK